jgi:hypothetical protein
MDGTQFDTIAQRLAAAATRRRLVAGVLGSAALLTGALAGVDAKKGGNGKGKKKAKGKTKVFICHKNDGGFDLIRVGAPAVKGHTKHGDIVCEAGVCQTGNPTGCDQATGACTGFALAPEGTDCTAEGDEVPHACDGEGNCAAV